jgi:hypothetical protein
MSGVRGNDGGMSASNAAATSSPIVQMWSVTPSAIAGVQRSRFVGAAKIVERDPKRDSSSMILQFL